MLTLLLVPAAASACTGAVTKIAPAPGGAWDDLSTWTNPNGTPAAQVPLATDRVCIPSGSAVGTFTGLDVAADIELDAGGTLDLDAPVTIGPGTGSVLRGTVNSPAGDLVLKTNTVYDAGSISLTGGQIVVRDAQLLIDNGMDVGGGGGGAVAIEAGGSININSTGANPTTFAARLENDGVFTNSGPVELSAGGMGNGVWKLGSGAGADEPVLRLLAGTYGAKTISDVDSGGLGHLVIGNAQLQMTDPASQVQLYALDLTNATSLFDISPGGLPHTASASIAYLEVTDGNFEVNAPLAAQSIVTRNGALLANGAWDVNYFHWGGGDIASATAGTVSANTLDLSKAGSDTGLRTTQGNVTITMGGGGQTGPYGGGSPGQSLTLGGTTVLRILPDAHFVFADDVDILGGAATIINEGIIDKKVGAAVGSRIEPVVQNDVLTGEMWVSTASSNLTLDAPPSNLVGGELRGTFILEGELRFPAPVTSFAGNWQLGAAGKVIDNTGLGSVDATTTITENAPGSVLTVQTPLALTNTFTNKGTMDVQVGGSITMDPGRSYTHAAGAVTKVAGALNVSGGGFVTIAQGTLSGTGTVGGNVSVTGGTLAPGNSPGTLTINGNLVMFGTGVIRAEIAGPAAGQFDQVVVTGQANLGGTLVMQSLGGYTPPDGQSFDLISAATRVGTFDSIVQFPDGPYFDSYYGAGGTPALRVVANGVSVSDVAVAEGDSGTVDAVFTVSLGAASPQAVSVDWATQDGSATAGSDYVAAGGSVNFAPGETSKTVAVVVNGDTVAEPSENFAVNLSNPSGSLVRDGQGVGTITNDEPVAVAAGPVPTQVPPGDIDGFAVPPPPVQGKAVNVEPVSGTVLVKLPRTTRFIRLPDAEQVPVGTIVDARKGRVRLFSVGTRGRVQSAVFFEGMFQVGQRVGQALTELKLVGGNFARVCGAGARAQAAATRRRSSGSKSVRRLWGDGKGQFRTKGRYASATIRGTKWLTDDRCNGTLVRVTIGAVTVRDATLRKSLVVKKPKSYLAPATKPRRRG